ncbi:MAG: OmpA family protein [Moraxellaceae bacterium]|nr:OmpA family protein [Moraxellaceae bacterium]
MSDGDIKMFTKGVLVLLGLGSCAYALAADVQNESWYVVPQVGIMIPDDSTVGQFVGLKLGKRFWDNTDIQIGYTHGQTKDRQSGYLSSEYSQDAIAVEALYELLPFQKFKPFVVAGVGYSKDDFVAQGNTQFAWQIGQPSSFSNRDESSNSWLVTLGGGLKYALDANKFVQADMRYFFSDSDTDQSNLYTSLGIGMHFGTVKPIVVKSEPIVEVKPEPIVEVKPEPIVEVKPEPIVEVKPEPKKAVMLSNLTADNLFAKGSAVLTTKAVAELDAAIMAAGVNVKALERVTIVGHADRTGNVVANQKLSERRAEAVKVLLVKKGVAADIITTQGKGSTQPITSLKQCPKSLVGIKLSACLAPDRRIDITME